MRTIELLTDTKVGIGSLGTNNLEKAKLLVSTALQIPESNFELHESSYLGWYYKYGKIYIKWSGGVRGEFDNDEQQTKYRIVVDTPSLETSQRIIDYYNSILVKGKPRF
jgi:hypothetical protein